MRRTYPSRKAAVFGFPYLDTLKMVSRLEWGHGCHFFARADENDYRALEDLLENGERICALFCEFPSNPLLIAPDVKRLGKLARKYGFGLVVDDTISGPSNVDVMQGGEGADVVCGSLTKVLKPPLSSMSSPFIASSALTSVSISH
jgi:cystathionine gamma-synthase